MAIIKLISAMDCSPVHNHLGGRIMVKQNAVKAVYENGVFRPLRGSDVTLSEGEEVTLTIASEKPVPRALELAHQVYEGLTEEEIDAIEEVILDRRPMFPDRELP